MRGDDCNYRITVFKDADKICVFEATYTKQPNKCDDEIKMIYKNLNMRGYYIGEYIVKIHLQLKTRNYWKRTYKIELHSIPNKHVYYKLTSSKDSRKKTEDLSTGVIIISDESKYPEVPITINPDDYNVELF